MKSIIKESDEIYLNLSQRKKELKLSNLDIEKRAKEYGVKAPAPSLSKYFTRNSDNNLSEQAILWMCDLFCVDVDLIIEKKEYDKFNADLKIKVKNGK